MDWHVFGEQVLDLLAANSDNLRAADGPGRCGLSLPAVSPLLPANALPGLDPHKMDYAAERLQSPGVMVKQVAEETGFTNPFHFSRVFKSVFGLARGLPNKNVNRPDRSLGCGQAGRIRSPRQFARPMGRPPRRRAGRSVRE